MNIHLGRIRGIQTKDPAYGIDATWITSENQEDAIRQGYTTVEHPMVIATHIGKILENNAYDLFGHDEAQQWLAKLKNISPRLADDLVPDKVNLTQLVRVCQTLLLEKIPITDNKTIASALGEIASKHKDADTTTYIQYIRVALKRMLIQNIVGSAKSINVYTLSSKLEELLLQTWKQSQSHGQINLEMLPIEPSLTAQLQEKMPSLIAKAKKSKQKAILLVAPQLRPTLSRIARICATELNIIAFTEIPDNRQIKIVGQLG